MNGDDQVEALAPAGPPDKPEVSELGHPVPQAGLVVAQLRPVVLVVAGAQGDQGAVLDVTQAHHLEDDRQRLV